MISFAIKAAIFAFLWMLMSHARTDSWIVGVPIVLAATITSVRLAPKRSWRLSFTGLFVFALYFIRSSFLGGLDVAWRSIHPSLLIDPQMTEYRLRLPAGTPRIFFINVVSLLPGTVSADTIDDVLTMHVIDGRQPIQQQLAELEQIVAGLFATQLNSENGEYAP